MYYNIDYPVKAAMFGRVTQKSGYWHSGRRLGSNLIICLAQGELEIKIDTQTYKAGTGDVLLIPEDTPYVPLESSGCTYYFFHFSAQKADGAVAGQIQVCENSRLPQGNYAYLYVGEASPVIDIGCHTRPDDPEPVFHICRRAAALNVFSSGTEKLALDNLLRGLLILLGSNAQSGSISGTLRKILLYMQENYATELSLPVIAEHFRLSESYIARLFRQNLNTCVSCHLNQIRVASACDLLVNSDMNIGEIAFAVGYASPYYFSRVFKQLLGASPLQFRREHI